MSIIKPRCLACFGAINFGGDDSTDRITQCGHVLCSGCAQYHAAQRDNPSVVDCPVCHRQTATTKLNSRMPAMVKRIVNFDLRERAVETQKMLEMHVGLLRHQVELLSRELENRARREKETQQALAAAKRQVQLLNQDNVALENQLKGAVAARASAQGTPTHQLPQHYEAGDQYSARASATGGDGYALVGRSGGEPGRTGSTSATGGAAAAHSYHSHDTGRSAFGATPGRQPFLAFSRYAIP